MGRPSYIAVSDGESSLVSFTAEATLETSCPICEQSLALSEFGVCRARPSGRSLYCKGCIRRKRNEERQELREHDAKKRQRVEAPPAPRWVQSRYDENGVLLPEELKLRCNPAHERVFAAIFPGARTQRQIMRMTNLSAEDVSDAIALLLLSDPPRIETRILRDDAKEVVRIYRAVAPARKQNLTAQLPSLTTNNILAPIMKGRAA